jgi:acetylcholinesterase
MNITVVNFNYRVGAMGFLASEEVRKGGDLNVGLRDEIKALEWTRKYISKVRIIQMLRDHIIDSIQFGGNPGHIVMGGASAGAGSLALLMNAYYEKDPPFVGIIGESPFLPYQPRVEQVEYQFTAYVNAAGCGSATDKMSCLRNSSSEVLQKANTRFIRPDSVYPALFPYLPVVDNDLLPDYSLRMFQKGQFTMVPTIFGDDTDEGSIFAPRIGGLATQANLGNFLKANYPQMSDGTAEKISKLYPEKAQTAQTLQYGPGFGAESDAYGELTFTCPGRLISDAVSKKLSKSWNYHYNVEDSYTVSQGFGVSHTSESTAVWGIGNSGKQPASYKEGRENAAIVPLVQGYWTSFVMHLDPNTNRQSEAPEWLPWNGGTENERRLLIQTKDGGTVMERVPDDQVNRCEVLNGMIEELQQ